MVEVKEMAEDMEVEKEMKRQSILIFNNIFVHK